MTARTRAVILFLVPLIVPFKANPQIGFEGFIKDVTDINFFYTCWNTRGLVRNDCGVHNGYGLEVSYELGTIPRGTKEQSWRQTGARVSRNIRGKDDTTFTYERITTYVPPRTHLLVEFALGYSQFSGFASSDTTFELRGLVREVPSVTMYMSLQIDTALRLLRDVSPYIGIRSGLIQLHNTQILDSLNSVAPVAYTGSASAFQLGAVGGIAVQVRSRLNFFAEGAQHIRRFASVQWSTPGTNKVPSRFPRELDFSGRAFSVGLQIEIREPK